MRRRDHPTRGNQFRTLAPCFSNRSVEPSLVLGIERRDNAHIPTKLHMDSPLLISRRRSTRLASDPRASRNSLALLLWSYDPDLLATTHAPSRGF